MRSILRNIRNTLCCAASNFRKWRNNPVILMLGILWMLVIVSQFIDVTGICMKNGYKVTPWLMPFTMLIPSQQMLYGLIVIILFAQAPFADANTPFAMIRTGKASWFVGQVLYIAAASLVITLFTFGCILVTVSPCMAFCTDWGPKNNAMLLDVAMQYNGMADKIMKNYTAVEATLVTMELQWISTMLIGCMTLFFNTAFRQGAGIIATSLSVVWSWYAVNGSAVYAYTRAIYRTAIFQWMSLFGLAPIIEKEGILRGDAISTMWCLIAFFVTASAVLFYKRDTHFTQSRF